MWTPIKTACSNAFTTQAAMRAAIYSLSLKTAPRIVKKPARRENRMVRSFRADQDKIEVAPLPPAAADEGWRIQISQFMFDWIEISSREVADLLYTALQLYIGEEVTMDSLLSLPVPVDAIAARNYEATLARYRLSDHQAACGSGN